MSNKTIISNTKVHQTMTHKKENRVFLNALAMATVLSFTLATQAAESLESKITATSDVQPIASSLSDKELRAVSIAAGRVLKHTEDARQKIADKNKDGALEDVEQGLKLIKIIENTVPKHKVITDIKSDGISYHDDEEVAQRYVTVFNDSYLEDIVTPVIQNKRAGKGIKNKAKSSIEDFSIVNQTSIKLDVTLSKRKLLEAKKQLNEGKFDNADWALSNIQYSGVVFEFNETEKPLVEATDNLLLARGEAKDGKYSDALATLKIASSDLKEYEKLTGKSHTAEVKKLYKEIDETTDSMKGKKDHKSDMKKLEEKISTWWDRTVKWARK